MPLLAVSPFSLVLFPIAATTLVQTTRWIGARPTEDVVARGTVQGGSSTAAPSWATVCVVDEPAAGVDGRHPTPSPGAPTTRPDMTAIVTAAALAFTAVLYLLYSVLDFFDPRVGFAPVQGPPVVLVLAMLPTWSIKYAKRVVAQPSRHPDPSRRDRLLSSPLIHLVAWWVPVSNAALPFLLLRSIFELDPTVRLRTRRVLATWAGSWSLLTGVLWAGVVGLVDDTRSAHVAAVALLAALSAGAGAAIVWSSRRRRS